MFFHAKVTREICCTLSIEKVKLTEKENQQVTDPSVLAHHLWNMSSVAHHLNTIVSFASLDVYNAMKVASIVQAYFYLRSSRKPKPAGENFTVPILHLSLNLYKRFHLM